MKKTENDKPMQINHHKQLREISGDDYGEDGDLEEVLTSDDPDSSDEEN